MLHSSQTIQTLAASQIKAARKITTSITARATFLIIGAPTTVAAITAPQNCAAPLSATTHLMSGAGTYYAGTLVAMN